ncbi:MAG TPA: DUF3107 domain-containing protein, partial [Mycobacteriales bacterium]|nr:DUF3107 domain-containing protein [Mycobacteriales bacterium]
MEVKIGVQHSPRELVVDSESSADEVEQNVSTALGSTDGVLSLVDKQGHRFLIPAAKVAYVEITEAESRPVGFVA